MWGNLDVVLRGGGDCSLMGDDLASFCFWNAGRDGGDGCGFS